MYRARAMGWLRRFDFILVEIIVFQFAFCVSCILRHGWVNPYSSILYRNSAIMAVLVQLIVFATSDTFGQVLKRGYFEEFKSVFKTTFLVMLFNSFYLFAVQVGGLFSRFVLIACAGFYFLFSYLTRTIMKVIINARGNREGARTSIVVVTTENDVRRVVRKLEQALDRTQKISGIILCGEVARNMSEIQNIPIVATESDAKEYLRRNWVDEVYIELSEEGEFLNDLIDTIMMMGMTAHYSVGNRSMFVGRQTYVQRFGEVTAITITQRTRTLRSQIAKRILDIVGAIIGLLITGILTIIIGPIIYFQSKGPIFFSQKRIGRNGKVFRIYKFRSMYMDAEERKKELMAQNEMEDGMMFKLENDPRIIGSEKGPGKGIGNFIRRTSLDEFPQFWNVLKGNMSLVGTRPPTEDEWEKYSFYHRSRMSVKPGITGLWQVSGRSEIKDFDKVMELDMEYIDHCSFGMDLRILLKTIGVVFGGKGAK